MAESFSFFLGRLNTVFHTNIRQQGEGIKLMRFFTIHFLASFVLLAVGVSSAKATTFDIHTAAGLFTPSFRGDASTTYVGWDSFDDNGAGDEIINDSTPDIGTDSGSFVTTNGEDHLSGSLNYYSGPGSVAEDISFSTKGTAGSGYTTVIVQAKTTFGSFNPDPTTGIIFSSMEGVIPSVILGDNAAGGGQLFAKYELLDAPLDLAFSMASAANSHATFGEFVIETSWSSVGFSSDTAINTPEPSTALLALLGMSLIGVSRRSALPTRGEK